MWRLLVIICCIFALGIAWTSIFELPEAPPKREITGKFGAGAVVRKAKSEPVSVKVAEPGTEAPEIVSYAEKSHWGRVTFAHTKHTEDYGFDCDACHHLQMEGGFNKCSSCHEDLKNTLHRNCFRECHRKLKAEGKKTGPTACTGCHIKEG
jgi:hypothetical protein